MDSRRIEFSTILASRGTNQRPSDLEISLVPLCKRLIVKGKHLSGAHLLFTTERIAVRAYYPSDLENLRRKEENKAEEEQMGRRNHKDASIIKDEDDFDSLSGFFSSFQLAVVLFILPSVKHTDAIVWEQLNDASSHFHRAQRLALKHEGKQQTSLSARNGNEKNLRVLLFPDTEAAMESLIWLASVVAPEKNRSKKEYFKRLSVKYFLPGEPNEACNNTMIEEAVAQHVAGGLHRLAQDFGIPHGEADILMESLGSLRDIAIAEEAFLRERVPVDKRTRIFLHSFFGSSMPPGSDLRCRIESFEQNPGEDGSFGSNCASRSLRSHPPSMALPHLSAYRTSSSSPTPCIQIRERQMHEGANRSLTPTINRTATPVYSRISPHVELGDDEIPELEGDNISFDEGFGSYSPSIKSTKSPWNFSRGYPTEDRSIFFGTESEHGLISSVPDRFCNNRYLHDQTSNASTLNRRSQLQVPHDHSQLLPNKNQSFLDVQQSDLLSASINRLHSPRMGQYEYNDAPSRNYYFPPSQKSMFLSKNYYRSPQDLRTFASNQYGSYSDGM